jgi:hypothetical protein
MEGILKCNSQTERGKVFNPILYDVFHVFCHIFVYNIQSVTESQVKGFNLTHTHWRNYFSTFSKVCARNFSLTFMFCVQYSAHHHWMTSKKTSIRERQSFFNVSLEEVLLHLSDDVNLFTKLKLSV